MKKAALVLIALSLISPLFSSADDEFFCPQVANYTMDIRLDTNQQLIIGKERLEWTNTTDDICYELWFHLYWNAFQNPRSTFLRERSRRGSILPTMEEQDWGYCRVERLQVVESDLFEGFDLLPRLTFRQPDDGNLDDRTVFSVILSQPIAPGQTIGIDIEFTAQVPRPISRTGVIHGYYFISQWFPKIGVFQEGRWICHQYHSTSEYFADYGTYDVKINLPRDFIIGATGEHRENILQENGTATHRFYQHSVHDFAWVAGPRLLQFDESYIFLPGKQTDITLLLQPYHRHLKERYMTAIKNALTHASRWFGDYPYSTITCVDPAYNSRSGGMEYPTFFTGGAYFLSPQGVPRPEGVTIHEFGHGYFYGLIGSNEFENPWMDEGMTSFLDSTIYYQAYGDPFYSRMFFGIPFVFRDVRIPIESSGLSRHRLTHNMDDLQRYAWHFMSGASYGANAYSKAELLMRTLQRFLGDEVFRPMIKAYSTRWWWKHPRPEDFYTVVSEFAGEDMSWFLDQFIYGSEKLDYAVDGIDNFPEGHPDKRKNSATGRRDRSREPVSYESQVLVRRLGGAAVPVDVGITFEDGRIIKERWDGRYRWKRFSYRSSSPVISAVVDPDFVYVLDVNRTNNSLTLKPNRLAAYKWASVWMAWLQHAFELLTHLGG